MFTLATEDDTALERRSVQAWAKARQIVRDSPPTSWPELPSSIPDPLVPDVRKLLNTLYLYGVLYCGATLQLVVGPDGLTVRNTALGLDDQPRHVSWETLLPFPDREIRPADARALAARLRALAAICDAMA